MTGSHMWGFIFKSLEISNAPWYRGCNSMNCLILWLSQNLILGKLSQYKELTVMWGKKCFNARAVGSAFVSITVPVTFDIITLRVCNLSERTACISKWSPLCLHSSVYHSGCWSWANALNNGQDIFHRLWCHREVDLWPFKYKMS